MSSGSLNFSLGKARSILYGGGGSGVPLMREFLTHEKPRVCVSAALALWRVTGSADESVPVLLQFIDEWPGELSQPALVALGQIGPAAAAAWLEWM